MNRSESSAEWSLLLLVTGLSGRFRKDSSLKLYLFFLKKIWGGCKFYLGEDDDVFAREFFLEFSDNFLLDFLPGLDLRLRNDDSDSLAARPNVEFLGALKINVYRSV